MSEKTVLEIGIYIAIVTFLLTIIALVDTMTKDNYLNEITSTQEVHTEHVES